MANNPSAFRGRRNPVEQVSWNDCQEFLSRLNAKLGTERGRFELPTEAQWEYACRAGSSHRFSFGDDEMRLGEYAWFLENSARSTHPVWEKKPNAWGLYDMHGNVFEWCADWYDRDYYAVSPPVDPKGPPTGSLRVNRGGRWLNLARYCCSSFRSYGRPDSRSSDCGLRIALVPGAGRTDPKERVSTNKQTGHH